VVVMAITYNIFGYIRDYFRLWLMKGF